MQQAGQLLLNMIQEPIILTRDGGAEVFRSKKEAERYAEPIDIQNGEYIAYDAAGKLLDLNISADGLQGALALPDDSEDRSIELADELREFLLNIAAVRQVPYNPIALGDCSLEKLVQLSLPYYSK